MRASSRKALNLKLHQAMGRKPDHLAQQVRVGGLLDQRAKVHHLVGHRWLLGQVGVFATRSYRRFADDHCKAARSLQRYLGGALASGFATAQLHHHPGHDLSFKWTRIVGGTNRHHDAAQCLEN
jgi:hypothetical protein